MGFFSKLLGGKSETVTRSASSEQESKILPPTNPEETVSNTVPAETNTLSNCTNMPIDAIYAYIDKDYEQQGYDDAMCNADSSYKESKKIILKNGLKRLFEQVKLKYKDNLRYVDVQINIVEQQGMMNTSASLNARKKTYLEHMETISIMEQELEDNNPKMLSMIDSYDRGFLKGLAAKSDSFLHYYQQ